MSEPTELIVVSLIFLLCVYIPSHIVRVYRLRRAVREIVQELDENEAYGPIMAVELSQLRLVFTRVGHMLFLPNALEVLTQQGIVKRTGTGKYYLEARSKLHKCTINCIKGGTSRGAVSYEDCANNCGSSTSPQDMQTRL